MRHTARMASATIRYLAAVDIEGADHMLLVCPASYRLEESHSVTLPARYELVQDDARQVVRVEVSTPEQCPECGEPVSDEQWQHELDHEVELNARGDTARAL